MNGLLTSESFIFAASRLVQRKKGQSGVRKKMPKELLVKGREKTNSDFIGNQGEREGGRGSLREREERREGGRSSFSASAHQLFEPMQEERFGD